MPPTPVLDVRDLTVAYHGTPATHDVSFQVLPGQVTAIVGESGSGKTTTAHAALGLLPDSATIIGGSVLFRGGEGPSKELTGLSVEAWRALRGRHIALIPQDPNNSLNPVKTVGSAIDEVLTLHTDLNATERRARIIELLERVGIDDPARRARQYPHELSGGMKQRVLIAAAIAVEPELIIADEPTSALDVTVQKKVLDLLDQLRRERGIAMVIITHDLAVAGDRADHLVVMKQGRVVEHGVAAAIVAQPEHPYTRQLLADVPGLAQTPQVVSAPVAADPVLEVDRLVQVFGDFRAVDGVSFQVARGTTHAVVGESGSGKTTTGRAIAQVQAPTSGRIVVAGEELRRRDPARVQLVYQNPLASLNPRRTVGQSVAEPLQNLRRGSAAAIRAEVERFFELVSLDPALMSRRPSQLSGGQRQRVAIARALIVQPQLVVLDEATSALDVTVQAQILRLLRDLQEELGVTYVFISHDLAVVRQISDTVSVLRRGVQVDYGPTEEIFERPRSEFTRQLLEAIPGANYRSGSLNIGL
ncbi:ABC transporter ATP-binding protein [Corynebacterium sp. 13CS0277]|uniref:dipeptide ABC transporter ATP-binding protein n=1 Tax=Corynebacterium sp. 13CS0277 TaxID=2071994 RepID=UPI000D0451A0|nr:ABC transporter ATP-binding protein [Corynebacterium sp. 13CS0277]PRQ12601.1 ABC transporter ATP-binding protein [Corynebacterium sp. 13CS0277]